MTVSRSRLIWEDTVRNTECKKVERMASVRALLTRRWKFGFHSRNEASVPTDYLSDRKALHPWLSMLISSFYSKKWWSTMWHSWWYDHDLFESVEMEMLLLTELCEQLFVSLFLEWMCTLHGVNEIHLSDCSGNCGHGKYKFHYCY